MTIYKDDKSLTVFTELCDLYESNDANFYDMLDAIVNLLDDEQLAQIEDIITNQYQGA
tara:strand:+ start:497 stop:670 length:174 start_codon:yes stop_codon:yes gene_type:complete